MRVKRDDGSELECEFEIVEHGSPGNMWDEPPTGPIIALTEARTVDTDELVELDDDERFKIEMWIAENIEDEPYDPEPSDL